ncbi:hypothetical protein quinque_009492 [Culex quinquefasciatus]
MAGTAGYREKLPMPPEKQEQKTRSLQKYNCQQIQHPPSSDRRNRLCRLVVLRRILSPFNAGLDHLGGGQRADGVSGTSAEAAQEVDSGFAPGVGGSGTGAVEVQL